MQQKRYAKGAGKRLLWEKEYFTPSMSETGNKRANDVKRLNEERHASVIYCSNGTATIKIPVALERGEGWRRTIFRGEFSEF